MRRTRVFLSYRRSDTAGIAGRVHDRLRQVLRPQDIFLDVTGINPGADFRVSIEAALARCDVVLVFIGPNWADGGRILEERDFVRAEIAVSLARGMPIVPVLVDGTAMPDPAELPEDIRALHFKQALRLSHATFDIDMAHLFEAALGITAAEQVPRARPLRTTVLRTCAGAAALLVLLFVAAVVHKEVTGRALSQSIGEPATAALIPAAALVGALLGWLSVRRSRRRGGSIRIAAPDPP